MRNIARHSNNNNDNICSINNGNDSDYSNDNNDNSKSNNGDNSNENYTTTNDTRNNNNKDGNDKDISNIMIMIVKNIYILLIYIRMGIIQ